MTEDQDALTALANGLADAAREIQAVRDDERRVALQRRLIAVTNAAKHDTATAMRRLSALMVELRSESASGLDSPPEKDGS